MKRVRKKRGWVHRTSFVCVTLLAITIGTLWVLSEFAKYESAIPTNNSRTVLDLECGEFRFYYKPGKPLPIDVMPGISADRFYFNHSPHVDHKSLLRHRVWLFTRDKKLTGFGYKVALPIPFAILLIWPLSAAIYRLRFRPRSGNCLACGYDLRGSKESAACPECGEAIKQSVARGAKT